MTEKIIYESYPFLNGSDNLEIPFERFDRATRMILDRIKDMSSYYQRKVKTVEEVLDHIGTSAEAVRRGKAFVFQPNGITIEFSYLPSENNWDHKATLYIESQKRKVRDKSKRYL